MDNSRHARGLPAHGRRSVRELSSTEGWHRHRYRECNGLAWRSRRALPCPGPDLRILRLRLCIRCGGCWRCPRLHAGVPRSSLRGTLGFDACEGERRELRRSGLISALWTGAAGGLPKGLGERPYHARVSWGWASCWGAQANRRYNAPACGFRDRVYVELTRLTDSAVRNRQPGRTVGGRGTLAQAVAWTIGRRICLSRTRLSSWAS